MFSSKQNIINISKTNDKANWNKFKFKIYLKKLGLPTRDCR